MSYEQRRENRLEKIKAQLADVLKETSPENADKYEIVYRPIKQYHSSIFRGKVDVLQSQSPAYGFFLVPKSNPKRAHSVMYLLREDIDKKLKNEEIRTYYQIPAFKENIQKGIESLQTKKARERKGFKEIRRDLEKI